LLEQLQGALDPGCATPLLVMLERLVQRALAMGDDFSRMSPTQIQGMQMMGTTPTRDNRVTWFLEGMLAHHGGALIMAHDALRKSSNPTIRRLSRDIIVAQRREILQLRKMLQHDGLNKPEYHAYDQLFSLP
jgi:uncharacterized protein (DUF305 family)